VGIEDSVEAGGDVRPAVGTGGDGLAGEANLCCASGYGLILTGSGPAVIFIKNLFLYLLLFSHVSIYGIYFQQSLQIP
jgi:hypothetical protein